jgi:predicted metallopeptidase
MSPGGYSVSALHVSPEPTRLCEHPLELRWGGDRPPLPLRAVRLPPQARRRPGGREAPPWYDTGKASVPFDFTAHIRRLCADMVARCEELRHIDLNRVLFGMTQARSSRAHGLQARVTPLRSRAGALRRHHRGVCYQVQRYFIDGREMLYLVTFCLPRFLDQTFDEKFITLFHELYHIGPAFDGDLRRHGGSCDLHSQGKKGYDVQMAHLARAYLAGGANPALHHFLRLDFDQLQHRHGSVVSVVVPRPKLIPVANDPQKGTPV